MAALCLFIPSAALATIHNVSSIAQLKAAMSVANPGDEIRIAYGVYQVRRSDDAKHWFTRSGTVSNPIRIVGVLGPNGERPVFDAGVPAGGIPSDYAVERGIFYIWSTTNNYVIENLEIRNARGQSYYSNNAAAAYIGGANITFRNCYSHHNDNGWFATTTASNTLLENCETAYNGKLPGASGDATHNHYMASASLTVRGCYIHDSTEGQNFKSRCKSVVFEYNWVENARNYEWELASDNANSSLMIGNVIIKNPASGNNRTIGLSDGGTLTGTLTMINNTIVSTTTSHRCFFSTTAASTNLVLYNNAFVGPSNLTFDSSYWSGTGSRTGSHNYFRSGTSVPAGITNSLFGTDPGVINLAGKDYHLLPSSILRNAGLNNPQYLATSGTWQVSVPDKEYLAHAQTKARLADATLDIGAFEGPLWPGDIDNDGAVDVVDLLYFVDSFGLSAGDPGYNPLCDLNGDGSVDVVDLLTLVEDFGKP
jgi:hypothetical protein